MLKKVFKMKKFALILICVFYSTFVVAVDEQVVDQLIAKLKEYTYSKKGETNKQINERVIKSRQIRNELIAIGKSNNYVSVAVSRELLNTPLYEGRSDMSSANEYTGGLSGILISVDRKALLTAVNKAYDSGKWGSGALSGMLLMLQLARERRDTNPTHHDFTDEELKPLILKASKDPHHHINYTAKLILVGREPPKKWGAHPIKPLDRDLGEALIRQDIEKAAHETSKTRKHKMLLEAGIGREEYIKYLKKNFSNTNTRHRFYYAEKLHKMGEMDDATFIPLQEEVKKKNKEALEAMRRGDIGIN